MLSARDAKSQQQLSSPSQPEPPETLLCSHILRANKDDLPPKLGLRNLLYPTVRFSKPGRESLSLLLTSTVNRFPRTHILEGKTGFSTCLCLNKPVHAPA